VWSYGLWTQWASTAALWPNRYSRHALSILLLRVLPLFGSMDGPGPLCNRPALPAFEGLSSQARTGSSSTQISCMYLQSRSSGLPSVLPRQWCPSPLPVGLAPHQHRQPGIAALRGASSGSILAALDNTAAHKTIS
jgi:hypothetical protein